VCVCVCACLCSICVGARRLRRRQLVACRGGELYSQYV